MALGRKRMHTSEVDKEICTGGHSVSNLCEYWGFFVSYLRSVKFSISYADDLM